MIALAGVGMTYRAESGVVEAALEAIRELPVSRGNQTAIPVVSQRGVEELGWA